MSGRGRVGRVRKLLGRGPIRHTGSQKAARREKHFTETLGDLLAENGNT